MRTAQRLAVRSSHFAVQQLAVGDWLFVVSSLRLAVPEGLNDCEEGEH